MEVSYFQKLMDNILNKEIKVTIIGMGYVGLPLAVELAKQNIKVYGYDKQSEKISKLIKGNSYIIDVDSSTINEIVESGYLTPVSDPGSIRDSDIIVICVPTPLTINQQPDISYIESALEDIVNNLTPGKLIILESTTYPGTTEEILLSRFSSAGYLVGENIFLCFSPERVDPGNKHYKTSNTPRIVGGITRECCELAKAFYMSVVEEVIPVSSPRVAEMTKLLENTFRSINISFINEMAILCDKLNIDLWEVIEAAKSKPFGFMPFYPGPGVGGHCIPLDPVYLSWKAKGINFYSRFIELAQEINKSMPSYVLNRIMHTLNKSGKPLKGSKVLLLGMSYKPDVDDLRESPNLELYELLRNHGAEVFFNDPYTSCFFDKDNNIVSSVTLEYETLGQYDCVVLLTNHSCYNYQLIYDYSTLIYDTRNGFKEVIDSKAIINKLGAQVNN